MLGKKTKAYIVEALEYFRKCLMMVRQERNIEKNVSGLEVNLEGLQKAVQALPKEDREIVEKFWGLTGGPNHSKKLANPNIKDVAFLELRNKAIVSLRKLLTLDYIMMYDTNLTTLIQKVSRKVDKNGIDISDMDIVKFLIAFSIYIENGPKMCFEEEPMSIDSSLDGAFLFDEYEVLHQMIQEINNFPDKSINLKLLTCLFEMINVQDMFTIKKSVGIHITDSSTKDVGIVRSVSGIREFKERMFQYGAWEVTTDFILGSPKEKISLEGFKEAISKKNSRNWVDMIEEFKTARKKELRTSTGIRILDIYEIGGLEFTDPQEIDFLYLYGDFAEI